ncbi:DNA-formamidopyrimidine glycosylase family protein [Undibacterium sp. Ji83W]|uniref:DNA-formamidopyrimidine glycosylase family protein n=1 Tax=Undibacterium sp. Ji83W TaxID=3413043 RepID=UPI003BEF9571
MPEGPSIRILQEAANGFSGKTVKKAHGNAKMDMSRMANQKIKAVRTWGKHFLIVFDDFTVRIHLLMFGSYRINEQKDAVPRLSLSFQDGEELNFYTCSIKYLEGDINTHYDWTADVMSDNWDAAAARKKLRDHASMYVCDALLEQDIFSGVGNIIKNEVLFRIRLHPLSLVGSLSSAKLSEMVTQARQYSFEFLEWKKAFVLKQHWLAHTKKICPRCHIPFLKTHLGYKKRRAFYCEKCQKKYA